jgi:carbon storage regulator
MIGHDIKVTVMVIAGDKVRIGIDAPHEVEVHREEVYLEIQEANRQAASTGADGVTHLTSVLREPGPDGATRPAGAEPDGAQPSDRGVSGSAAR